MGRAFEAPTGMSKVPGDAGTRAPVLVALRAPLVTSRSQRFHRPLFQKLHFTTARPPNSQEGEARRRGPPRPRHSGTRTHSQERAGWPHLTVSCAAPAASPQKHSEKILSQIAQQLKLLVFGAHCYIFITPFYCAGVSFVLTRHTEVHTRLKT